MDTGFQGYLDSVRWLIPSDCNAKTEVVYMNTYMVFSC